MSRFSDLATDLSTGLSAALTDTTFAPGNPPESLPPASTAVGFVYVDKWAMDTSNELQAQINVMVRVYPIQAEQFDGTVPIDPSPLYDSAANVQAAVKAGWEPSDQSVWFYKVLNIVFDHQNQFIEAEIEATTWNDATVGA